MYKFQRSAHLRYFSVAIFLGIGVMWLLSHYWLLSWESAAHFRLWIFSTPRGYYANISEYQLWIHRGAILLNRATLPGPVSRKSPEDAGWKLTRIHPTSNWWKLSWSADSSGTQCILPLWIPFILASLSTMWLWRPRRADPLCCPNCAYNLTGNTGMCPECGRVIRLDCDENG